MLRFTEAVELRVSGARRSAFWRHRCCNGFNYYTTATCCGVATPSSWKLALVFGGTVPDSTAPLASAHPAATVRRVGEFLALPAAAAPRRPIGAAIAAGTNRPVSQGRRRGNAQGTRRRGTRSHSGSANKEALSRIRNRSRPKSEEPDLQLLGVATPQQVAVVLMVEAPAAAVSPKRRASASPRNRSPSTSIASAGFSPSFRRPRPRGCGGRSLGRRGPAEGPAGARRGSGRGSDTERVGEPGSTGSPRWRWRLAARRRRTPRGAGPPAPSESATHTHASPG